MEEETEYELMEIGPDGPPQKLENLEIAEASARQLPYRERMILLTLENIMRYNRYTVNDIIAVIFDDESMMQEMFFHLKKLYVANGWDFLDTNGSVMLDAKTNNQIRLIKRDNFAYLRKMKAYNNNMLWPIWVMPLH